MNLTRIDSLPLTCVTLGYFGGIHADYQTLIERCVSDTEKYGVESYIIKSFNLPKTVIED